MIVFRNFLNAKNDMARTGTLNNPSGTVIFKDGATTLGSAPVSAGMATYTLSGASAGAHSLSAQYSGDTSNAASTSAVLALYVDRALVGSPMSWQYGYDALGNPTTTADAYGRSRYTYYDRLSRPIQTQQAIGAEQAIISLEYNPASDLTKVTDPRNLATTYNPDGLGQVTSQNSPDSGSASQSFDAKGNLTARTDARGKTTSYSYDALDRLTRIRYASGTDTTFEYDGGATPVPAAIGSLTKITDESGQTVYAYDSAARLTSKTQSTNGKTFTVSYGWGDGGSALDKLTSITYPSGNRVNLGYDSYGQISTLTLTSVNGSGGAGGSTVPLLANITRNASGQITGWNWANGKAVSRTYDAYGQPKSYPLGDPSTSGATRTLAYDASGAIVGFSHSGAGSTSALNQSFAYDDLGRLTLANIGSSTTQYSYDLSGNRTAKTIGAASYSTTIAATSNRITQSQDVGGTSAVQYDAAGNITSDAIANYTYSDRGRLASLSTAEGSFNYRYNALELRTFKTGPVSVIPTGQALYVYDEAGRLLGEYDASGTPLYETVYLANLPVAVIKLSGSAGTGDLQATPYNVYADHLGTPRMVTRASDDTPVWRWDTAETFGASAPDENPSSLGAFTYNQRMPGQVFDAETGLFDNWHRTYGPRQGRYTQSDPIGLNGGPNGYLYAEANPLTYTDPLGLWGVADLPSIPQPVVDFGAGMGDTILFGQGPRIRDALGVDGGVDQCSDAYDYGEWAGIGASLATGFAGGVRAAGVKGAGKEFSHWIPNRMGGPRTIFNGNYVPTATHAVSDPYRYRFMPRAWKAANPPMSGPMAQWTRIPNVYKGAAAGGAYGAAGAAQTGCTCRR